METSSPGNCYDDADYASPSFGTGYLLVKSWLMSTRIESSGVHFVFLLGVRKVGIRLPSRPEEPPMV